MFTFCADLMHVEIQFTHISYIVIYFIADSVCSIMIYVFDNQLQYTNEIKKIKERWKQNGRGDKLQHRCAAKQIIQCSNF